MFRSTLVLAIAVAALAAPTGAAALEPQGEGQGSVDLRSPDTRDAGQVTQRPTPAPVIVDRTGFDWGDAGIGAGSVLGLLLIALSVMFAVIHRRRSKEGTWRASPLRPDAPAEYGRTAS